MKYGFGKTIGAILFLSFMLFGFTGQVAAQDSGLPKSIDADAMKGPYRPTWESLDQHKAPAWYEDAKFGIFIHWGIYSVPAWAPVGAYAEWYAYRIQDEDNTDFGRPTSGKGKVNKTFNYHQRTYGGDFHYRDFIPRWKAENWDPDRWAALFKDAGARYVVLTAEHHDGFPLWDSKYTHWDASDKGPKRDLVGDLAKAVRERGMKFGVSYHAMLNYYAPKYNGPNPDYLSADYVRFMNKKMKELIDTYRPDILWLDGDWKAPADTFRSKAMVAYYYNQAEKWGKEVAVNDRLGQVRGEHGDFYTQEYEHGGLGGLSRHKWESVRALGASFGYNQNETPSDYIAVDDLVDEFIDNVSKNANMLLDVGPKADGTIPETQKQRLRGLGDWLDENGSAIYGTRPWVTSSAPAESGGDSVNVRFTQKQDTVYPLLLETPSASPLTLQRLYLPEGSRVRSVPGGRTVSWQRQGPATVLSLPADMTTPSPAHTLRITPQPWRLLRKTFEGVK